MEGFSAGWLALREPADTRARSAPLTRAIDERLRRLSDVRVLDLAAGTGANLRYLAPAFASIAHRQSWLLVDHDPALLAQVKPQAEIKIETRVLDLVAAFEPSARNLCAGRHLVTASALLDLVSARWLGALARCCRAAGSAVLFALTYNGEIRCVPEEPDDARVRELVNRHQRTDKGFGPALGPDAARIAKETFASVGYEVHVERSDWVLSSSDAELQAPLVEGWARAAAVIAPGLARQVDGWKARRLAHVAAGRSQIVVGHDDLAGWLPSAS